MSPLRIAPWILEWGLRGLCAGMLSIFWLRAFSLWRENPAPLSLLLLLIAETLTVSLVVLNRTPRQRDWHPAAVFASLLATFYFLALDLSGGTALLPETPCVLLISAGLSWQIYAKLSLGRAFGLLPGYRSIETRGAYRYMRHPIYLGYLISHMGFLLANASVHNLLVYAGLYALQWVRMRREEQLLERQTDYRMYQARVRWRLLPGIY